MERKRPVKEKNRAKAGRQERLLKKKGPGRGIFIESKLGIRIVQLKFGGFGFGWGSLVGLP